MANELSGKTVAFLVANEGIEQVELTKPWQAVEEAGGRPVLVAPKNGKVQAYNHLDKADTFKVDLTTDQLSGQHFDGIVLPGGVANPDQLRMDKPAMEFLSQWTGDGRPVAAICHGAWTLVEVGAVKGRTVTSWPSLQTDIRNAGGTWVDEEVHTDGHLVTSRKPDDLDAFCAAFVKLFSSPGAKDQAA
jgi:protease I